MDQQLRQQAALLLGVEGQVWRDRPVLVLVLVLVLLMLLLLLLLLLLMMMMMMMQLLVLLLLMQLLVVWLKWQGPSSLER